MMFSQRVIVAFLHGQVYPPNLSRQYILAEIKNTDDD